MAATTDPSAPTSPLLPPAAVPVVVLAADAVVAALPATAVQLAHACLAAGYRSAVPASWGDELVAQACLAALADRPAGPAVLVACPSVAARFRASGDGLARHVVSLAAPAVAAARYLRALAPGVALHVTVVGGCPVDGDPAVDLHRTAAEFLAALEARGIVPCEQPTAFDAVLPPDRRRHVSLPGGLPTDAAVAALGRGHRVVELTDADYATELGELLLEGDTVLVDLAPALGCRCLGATGQVPPGEARRVVTSLEPPRSPVPVMDHRVPVSLARAPASLAAAPAAPAAAPVAAGGPGRRPACTPVRTPARTPVRTPASMPLVGAGRRTPVGLSRVATGAPPLARGGDGRLLPRAYVAHRHSLPRLAPIVPNAAPVSIPGAGAALAAPVAAARPMAASAAAYGPAARPAPAVAAPEPAPWSPAGGPATAVATPPHGGQAVPPPCPASRPAGSAAGGYAGFVNGVTAAVTRHTPPPPPAVEGWRARLDGAIAVWRARGYRTGVLERARSLPRRPDVTGLLATYIAAADHLRRLEAMAAASQPALRGHAAFRDPERVAEAEAFVDGLFVRG